MTQAPVLDRTEKDGPNCLFVEPINKESEKEKRGLVRPPERNQLNTS